MGRIGFAFPIPFGKVKQMVSGLGITFPGKKIQGRQVPARPVP
jgi:hypothetical protein